MCIEGKTSMIVDLYFVPRFNCGEVCVNGFLEGKHGASCLAAGTSPGQLLLLTYTVLLFLVRQVVGSVAISTAGTLDS